MKVKVGDLIFDPNLIPIMLIFDDGDRELIASTNSKKMAFAPDSMTHDEVLIWMGENEELAVDQATRIVSVGGKDILFVELPRNTHPQEYIEIGNKLVKVVDGKMNIIVWASLANLKTLDPDERDALINELIAMRDKQEKT